MMLPVIRRVSNNRPARYALVLLFILPLWACGAVDAPSLDDPSSEDASADVSPVDAEPSAASTGSLTIGETGVFSSADNGNAGVLIAQSASLSQAATLASLSIYVSQAAGKLTLGVYDASGPNGRPGALLASTASFTPVVGWNKVNVAQPRQLQAGSYWLAYLPTSNNLSTAARTTSSSSGVYYYYGSGALPGAFSSSASAAAYHWSFFASLNAIAAVPPATMGETQVFSSSDSGNAGVLIAESASLAQAGTLASLSIYVSQAGGSLTLGVYDATGSNGRPRTLLASTASFTPVVGWNKINVTQPKQLQAGSYWLAYLPTSNGLTTVSGTTSASSGLYYYYGSGALPAAFSSSPSTVGYHWSFYATLDSSGAGSDTSPPSAPVNLQGVAASSSQVSLSWAASTDNVGVAGYRVFRNGGQVGTSTTTGYSDTGLAAGTSYAYSVAAYDAAGNVSAQSASVNVTTSASGGSGPFTLGQVPFAAASSWNTPIPSNTSYTNVNWPASTGYNYSVSWDSYSAAVYVSSPSDPLVQVTYPAGWGYPGGTLSVRMPAGVDGAPGTDGELLIVDGTKVHNFWIFHRTSLTTANAQSYGVADIVTGSGWGTKSPFLSAGITAAGSSQMAGILVQAETDAGEILHALNLRGDSTIVAAGVIGQAISSDGSAQGGVLQEGQRYAIPRTTAMPSGLSPLGQKVFRSLQSYGAYVTDVSGGCTNFGAQENAYDDASMTALWHDAGTIIPLLKKVPLP